DINSSKLLSCYHLFPLDSFSFSYFRKVHYCTFWPLKEGMKLRNNDRKYRFRYGWFQRKMK
ncbi:unnamed protein product, partial [Arabidopsis halleri]